MCGGPHQPPSSAPFDTGLLGDTGGGSVSSLLLFVHRVQGLPAGL